MLGALPRWVSEEMKEIHPEFLEEAAPIRFDIEQWEAFHPLERAACYQLSALSFAPIEITHGIEHLPPIRLKSLRLGKRKLEEISRDYDEEYKKQKNKHETMKEWMDISKTLYS